MVSDFIDEKNGNLELTDPDFTTASATNRRKPVASWSTVNQGRGGGVLD